MGGFHCNIDVLNNIYSYRSKHLKYNSFVWLLHVTVSKTLVALKILIKFWGQKNRRHIQLDIIDIVVKKKTSIDINSLFLWWNSLCTSRYSYIKIGTLFACDLRVNAEWSPYRLCLVCFHIITCVIIEWRKYWKEFLKWNYKSIIT